MSLPRFNINLFIHQNTTARREAIRGVARFAAEQSEVDLELLYPSRIGWPEALTMHGAIAWPDIVENMYDLQRENIPVVCLETWAEASNISQVGFDNFEAGKLIADYFLERGLRGFAAFLRDHGRQYSNDRLAGFRSRLRQKGFNDCREFDASEHGDWQEFLKRGGDWLATLPQPVGVLADTDFAGYNLLLLARHYGLKVPDELAVISIGGDELICSITTPPMTSVKLPSAMAGYLAAKLLTKQLLSGQCKPEVIYLDSFPLIERRSSNLLAVEDREVQLAVRYIKDHAADPISVSDILRVVPLCRRSLEMRFKKSSGLTLQEAINKAHVEQAKKLLAGTTLTIAEVALRSGFSEPPRLNEVFRREVAMTPKAYREKMRYSAMSHGI